MLIFCPTFYHMSMCLWHSWLRREKLVQVREVEGQARHNFESSSFSLPRCFHLLQCQEIGSSDRGNTQHKLARYVLALYLNLKTCKSSGQTEVCPSSVVEMQQIHHLGRNIWFDELFTYKKHILTVLQCCRHRCPNLSAGKLVLLSTNCTPSVNNSVFCSRRQLESCLILSHRPWRRLCVECSM